MTHTLGEIAYRTAVEAGIVEEGVTTSLGTSAIQYDTFRSESPDYWKSGAIWSLVPASVFTCARITQFDPGNGAISHGAGISALASGSRYAIARGPVAKSSLLDMLFQKVNQALVDIGPIPLSNTSLTTVSGQTEYTLPYNGMLHGLRRVFVQTNKDGDDNMWQEVHNWSIMPPSSHTATTMSLIVPANLPDGYSLRLDWISVHPMMDDASDALAEIIPLNRIVYPATLKLLEWFKLQTKRNDWDDMIRIWADRVDMVKMEFRVPSIPIRSKLMIAGNGDAYYPGSRSGN